MARDGRRPPDVRDFDPVLKLVRRERGTAARLARELGISRPAVWRWKRVPAEYVMPLETLLKIPRHRIRPDLYPRNRERA